MTRFYTKNSQLNSTNLHSWGMLKKIQLKKPTFFLWPTIPTFYSAGEKRTWGEHPKQISPKWNDLNFTFPLHTGSKWWEYYLQFIFFSCRFLWKQKNQKALKTCKNPHLSSQKVASEMDPAYFHYFGCRLEPHPVNLQNNLNPTRLTAPEHNKKFHSVYCCYIVRQKQVAKNAEVLKVKEKSLKITSRMDG